MRHQALDEQARDGTLPSGPSPEVLRERNLATPVTRADLIALIEHMEGYQRYNSISHWLHKRWGLERRFK